MPACCHLPQPPESAPPSPGPAPHLFHRPLSGYSASKIPEDNKDLTFEGALHDIAVVKLATAVSGTPATVALASADTPVTESEKLQVAGWGTTENGQPSNILK